MTFTKRDAFELTVIFLVLTVARFLGGWPAWIGVLVGGTLVCLLMVTPEKK